MKYPIAETAHSINGVNGRMYPIHAPQDVRGRLVHRAQKWVSEFRPVKGYGTNGQMNVEIRFDDECKNGHQTFAITASVYTAESRRMRDIAAGGCMHEEIANVFPELAPLIRWHLMSTDSPMHYVANAVYHASDRDHNGRRKGEPSAWEHVVYFGTSPVSHKIKGKFSRFIKERMQADQDGGHYRNELAGEFRVTAMAHEGNSKPGAYQFGPKFTFAGFADKWHECPFDDEHTAQEWAAALNGLRCEFASIPTAYSEGKARDLDAARRAANWPDATDEELSADPETLKAALLARLPAMVAEFRTAMESAGFMWEPEQPDAV